MGRAMLMGSFRSSRSSHRTLRENIIRVGIEDKAGIIEGNKSLSTKDL
jgi:hypothetical protein